jgi:hypothetical protein
VRAAVVSRAFSFPEKASADSAEKNAGARGKGGFVLNRARRIVRQVRTFRTISDPPRTGGCSAGALGWRAAAAAARAKERAVLSETGRSRLSGRNPCAMTNPRLRQEPKATRGGARAGFLGGSGEKGPGSVKDRNRECIISGVSMPASKGEKRQPKSPRVREAVSSPAPSLFLSQ